MPLMLLDPPMPRPRGHVTRFPSSRSDADVSYFQFHRSQCIGMLNAVGILVKMLNGPETGDQSPASTSVTDAPPSASRLATTHPALPAPTTT